MKKALAIAVVVFITLVAIASIVFSLFEPQPKPDLRSFQETGRILAEETCKALENRGRIVLVSMASEVQKIQLQAFQDVLKKQGGGVTVAAVENFKPEEVGKALAPGIIPADLFRPVLQRHADATAVVSFVGPPAFTAKDISTLPSKRPLLIVLAPFGGGLKKLLQTRVIQLAIAPRMGPPPGKAPSGRFPSSPPPEKEGPRAWFDERYQIFTPQSDLSQLYEPPMPPMPPPPSPRK